MKFVIFEETDTEQKIAIVVDKIILVEMTGHPEITSITTNELESPVYVNETFENVMKVIEGA